MAKPIVGDWRKMKKVGRFLVGRKRVVWRYRWQDEGQRWRVYTDSDWAGCRKTRKSSSGGVLMLGVHCIKAWCSTQGALALSSAEAEFYSMVEGVLRVKGLANIGREIGLEGGGKEIQVDVKEVEVGTDSSAAKGFVSKRGVGKMRHMEVKWLWLQEEVQKRRVVVKKVRGGDNPADVVTKYLTRKEVMERLGRVGIRVRDRGGKSRSG